MDPIKIRASSAAFAKGDVVYTRYNAGCLRKIYLNSRGLRETLKQTIQDIGAANEERYEAELKKRGIVYDREVTVLNPIDDDGSTVFSGRYDFCVYSGTVRQVVELKSTSSKNKLRELKQGHYTPENIAQLINYMIETEALTGRLIYTFYDNGTAKYEREFTVSFSATGDILVDSALSGFVIDDAFHHRRLAINVQKEHRIANRPFNHNKPYESPCDFCVFKTACDVYDTGVLGTQEFVDKCSKLV